MVETPVRIAQMLATFTNTGDTRSGLTSEAASSPITLLFPRSLPCGYARRVLLGEQTLFRLRFCLFWRPLPLRSRPFPPCRRPSRLRLSLWAGNQPYTRFRDRFRYVLFAGRTL